jgi:hypothetical protein
MTKPHYNVVIATPGRSMESPYVKSLVATLQYLNENGISSIYLNEYSSQVTAAREATAMNSMFLNIFNSEIGSGEFTYDKIIWIDSDISWTVTDFMRLYESDKEIVSGVYFNHTGVPMFSMPDWNIGDIGILRENEKPFEIAAAGFGFICMKSGVFESLSRPWFESAFSEVEDGEGNKAVVPFGEDYSWCTKAASAGHKLWLDPRVLLTHHKNVSIDGRMIVGG